MEVFSDRNETLSDLRLSLELVDSIKTIGVRISELKSIIKDDKYERRLKLVERMERMVETRMNLIYSFMDIKSNRGSENPFINIDVTYKDFNNGLG